MNRNKKEESTLGDVKPAEGSSADTQAIGRSDSIEPPTAVKLTI